MPRVQGRLKNSPDLNVKRSLFVASYFNRTIVERDNASIRNMFAWNHQNWSRVMLSNEYHFSVTSDSSHQLLWRESMEHIMHKDAAILAIDPTRIRPFNQDYRVYLVRLYQCGLLGQIEISTIHRYADLYELARHEPGNRFAMVNCMSTEQMVKRAILVCFQDDEIKNMCAALVESMRRHVEKEFNEEHFLQFIDLMVQIQLNISSKASSRQPTISKNVSSAHSSESTRHFTNGKVPAVPSCLQVEPSIEDTKSTYETSV
ncbi:uncharacterized protein TNCV_2952521 [Trichonephila clavipes]|nr:uncharacterized protein TNCV_2952521 [Trichonephila clavipes]